MPNTKKILKRIAKQNGISVNQARKEMQEAINAAYATPNFYARCIPSKGKIPTIEEFINYSTNRTTLLRG